MPSPRAQDQILRPAAYCVIYDDADRLLLTEWVHRDTVHRTGWTLPGGGMEFGESPQEAARREVYEETGFEVEILGAPLVQSVYFKRGELRSDGEFQALRFIFRARMVSGSLAIVDVGGTTTDAGFFTLHDAHAKGLSPTVAEALEYFPPTHPVSLDHIQLAIPNGGEDKARGFWVGILGLKEVEKPAALQARGGAHFEGGELRIHVGVDPHFVPSTKAHPAFRVRDLDMLATKLAASAYEVRWSDEIPGTRRFHTDDPFGNRLEFMA